MILRIRVENMKDATGIKKRVMFATLTTDIEGLERIDAVSELDEECTLGKEITFLTTELLSMRKKQIEIDKKELIKNKKKKK